MLPAKSQAGQVTFQDAAQLLRSALNVLAAYALYLGMGFVALHL
jgi:hypothetical protein